MFVGIITYCPCHYSLSGEVEVSILYCTNATLRNNVNAVYIFDLKEKTTLHTTEYEHIGRQNNLLKGKL